MAKSVLDELFGEFDDVVCQKDCEKEDKKLKVLLGFFLSVLVISLTFLFSFFYFEFGQDEPTGVLGEKIVVEEEAIEDTSLDVFIEKFTDSNYKVTESGAFGYIYGDSEDGVISLGHDDTYFTKGRITFLAYSEDIDIVWGDYNQKFILFNNKMEYFLVGNSSDFYYKKYLGQHILQDFVDDYIRNKDFIIQIDEDLWDWEWSFYTPMSELSKHIIQSEVKINPETNYLESIRLLDGEKEICVFQFSFEKHEGLDVREILQKYKRVEEPEVNSF